VNGYDENGNYVMPYGQITVPGGPNVMSEGNTLAGGATTLQSYITSPINQQPRDSKKEVLSIKQAYIHRFGNNTPNATLPTQ